MGLFENTFNRIMFPTGNDNYHDFSIKVFDKAADKLKGMKPANAAQWTKMGLHLVADLCSFIPPPGHFIGTAVEGGAYIAGRCDNTSSKEAEDKEAGIRAAVSLIPWSGVAKISSKPLMYAVKYGVGVGVKEGLSTWLNIHENIKNGKLLEITNSEAMIDIKGEFQEAGKDFDKLEPEQKAAALRTYYTQKAASNQHIVDDDSRQRISEKDFLERNGLAPKPVLADTLRAEAKAAYLEISGKKASDLDKADAAKIEKIYQKTRERLEKEGTKIIDLNEKQKNAAIDIRSLNQYNLELSMPSMPLNQVSNLNATSAFKG